MLRRAANSPGKTLGLSGLALAAGLWIFAPDWEELSATS